MTSPQAEIPRLIYQEWNFAIPTGGPASASRSISSLTSMRGALGSTNAYRTPKVGAGSGNGADKGASGAATDAAHPGEASGGKPAYGYTRDYFQCLSQMQSR